jgi:5-methylcytosine-specific restriction protein A
VPGRSKSICRSRGCGKVIDRPGFCDTHKKAVQKQQDERRGTAYERGYDNKWAKARAAYLRRHPLCVYCQRENRLTAATVVDHRVAHRLKEAIDSGDTERITKARSLFWDSSNWQPLCGPCHNSRKQSEERATR